jgi:hypothetical protein
MTLVELCRRESHALFPERMRDGHSYHPTAMTLDKAADALEAAEKALEDIANAMRLGAETDVQAWASLAYACQETARAALPKLRGTE